MTFKYPLAYSLAATLLLGVPAARAAMPRDWQFVNKCRQDDCYAAWVRSVKSSGTDVYKITVEYADFDSAQSDMPNYKHPTLKTTTVSCTTDDPYVEDEWGKIYVDSDMPASHSNEDQVDLWQGVCNGVYETVN
jgi:hypothetical protein